MLLQLFVTVGTELLSCGGPHLFYVLGLCGLMTVTGGVGWFAPKSTNHRVFTRFYLCLVEPQEQRVTLQSKRDFIFQICNNNLLCIEIIHLRETQAIFILFFLGPFFKNKIKTKK